MRCEAETPQIEAWGHATREGDSHGKNMVIPSAAETPPYELLDMLPFRVEVIYVPLVYTVVRTFCAVRPAPLRFSVVLVCVTLDSLFGGEVNAVEGIPHHEDGRHVAEHQAVEAEGDYHRQEQHV